jgi:diguanylate cyclase (GGDEF)-like protein
MSFLEAVILGIANIKIQSQNVTFQVTISIGAATLTDQTKSQYVKFENLIQEADTQLYKAKSSGRNKVCA